MVKLIILRVMIFISIKDLVRIISNIQNKNFKKHTKNVKDRKGKDLNYILSNKKIKKLRWSPKKVKH